LHVTTDDVKAVAHPVLRHRLVTTFLADSENISSDDLVDMLLEQVPVELVERAVSRVP
jgi:MoxR-like ATPase